MSRLFMIAIAAALLVVPTSAAVGADEAASETKQACDKEKCCKDGTCSKGCCKDGQCKAGCDKKERCENGACQKGRCQNNQQACQEGGAATIAKCTKCKCENCSNAQCDTDNCQCAASKTCNCPCEGAASCDQTVAECGELDFHALTLVAATGAGDRASGKCCKSKCNGSACCQQGDSRTSVAEFIAGDCCIEGGCCEAGIAGCAEGRTLNWGGNSILAITLPSPLTVESADNNRWTAPRDWSLRWPAESESVPAQRFRVKVASNTEVNQNATAGESAEIYPHPVPTTTRHTVGRIAKAHHSSNTTVHYNIQIVEDHGECFGEYEGLRNGRPIICAESKTLLPTIRTLEKHQLIRQVSSPQIRCVAGHKAELEVCHATSDEPQRLNLEVGGDVTENDQLMVEVNLCAGEEREFAVCAALTVEPGQSIVLNATRPAARNDEEEANEPAIFIVVTPEIIK